MASKQNYWDYLHDNGKLDHAFFERSSFAIEAETYLPSRSKVLELGCGVGTDSYYFAQKSHDVVATDLSETAIQKNIATFYAKNLTFQVHDMSNSLPFQDKTFDMVYARLSLHYFSDEVTKKIVKDIHRVLKKEGYFCFLCKSTRDRLYGLGKELEKDMYDAGDHIRHFFSDQYVRSLLHGLFEIIVIEEGNEVFYDHNSAYIKVIAKALKT